MVDVKSVVRRTVQALMRYEIRASFRQVVWMNDTRPGKTPHLPPDQPVILYANHHHFYDGHLLWYLLEDVLGRPGTIWMNDWHTFPFFAAVGAQPFPPDDAARRSATVRRTARRFRERPSTVMVYFPEAELHAAAEGILPFRAENTERLTRLYPAAWWWPVAIHVTSWGDKHPTACLRPGPLHRTADGREHERLQKLWHTLRDMTPNTPHHALLGGRRSPSDVWDFSFTAPYFERFL